MQFSDTTDYQGLIQHIDFLLFGKSTVQNPDYSIEDRTRNINIAYGNFTAELFQADPNFEWDDTNKEDFPIATTTLNANQDNYTIPDGALVVQRLRVHNKVGKYKTLEPKQRREFTDDQLQQTGEPDGYYKIGNSFFLVPKPDYSGALGVEFEFQREASYFVKTDTTKEPGFAGIFHHVLAVDAALVYALANGMKEKVAMLQNMRNEIKMAVQEHYQRRSPDRENKLELKRRTYGTGL